jgi:hypothetical protein
MENSLETKVTLLERDHERFMVLLERMDSNLNKITELSTSVKQMLAVQENRLDYSEDKHSITEKRLEKHSDRLDALEKWRWYLSGAIFIVGFAIPMVISHILKN